MIHITKNSTGISDIKPKIINNINPMTQSQAFLMSLDALISLSVGPHVRGSNINFLFDTFETKKIIKIMIEIK